MDVMPQDPGELEGLFVRALRRTVADRQMAAAAYLLQALEALDPALNGTALQEACRSLPDRAEACPRRRHS
ncbi:hypothetical protein [Methylobacterium isbiliense]|jgi:hypothetical protein|uniref:Uncharacterized protein n=1 Tax=Methylobacterium isbiliense TaxID=315478 RepID=A0ABQ4SIZ2_9HYPH|nr:hypothetical protein [Methylobacterium isbiliense]MDN3627854.1 hypothetical protein [Methylobacterium isbiliense]GJE02470.1 hypothetical protein GMJLKIPL_4419 [Methylobacterium isbiliense]